MKKFITLIICVIVLSSCGGIPGRYVDTPSHGILWADGTFTELPDGGDGEGND